MESGPSSARNLNKTTKVPRVLPDLLGAIAREGSTGCDSPDDIHGGSMKIRHTDVRKSVFSLLICLISVHGWAQQNDQRQQMKGLDEQVQEIKSVVLSIAADLNRLEEKLLYPSETQVAIFVALAKGDQMRLDAVRLQIDGHLVAH